MPPIGLLLGGVDFSKLKLTLQPGKPEIKDGDGKVVTEAVPEVAIAYGEFMNDVLSLIIVGFAVFMLVKGYNAMKKEEEEKPAEPEPDPEPSDEVKLLTEIRDALNKS